MPTTIDSGLTVQDAINADHSPHIFTMSNGDLLAIYYDGTNLVWRSKSGGAWSASTTITLDTGVTPPQVSYWTRNGDAIYGGTSKDPIDATHNADFFELTYTPATHTLATTSKQVDAADGAEKIAGYGFSSGGGANDKVFALHGNAAGNFGTIQELNVNPTIVGVDQSPTFMDYRSSARTGLVTDGTTTTYLMYGCSSTGTAFAVERFTAGTNADNVESPPAPAANPAGITAVYDGTNYYFIINENNAKLRYLKRTGTNTYGTWTDILSDASLTGQPAACVKANGDLAVFYRTNKNFANGEIWVVQRTSGTWGSPTLLAGGANTGWSNPSCAASDLNDSGNARVVYVTGTASTWTLVEDNHSFAGGTSTLTRTVPASAALLATDTRAVPTSAALLATDTRQVPASAALLGTPTRAVPSSAALLATDTRAVPASAALLATDTRVVPSTAALLATATRVVPTTAALIATLTRAIPASVQVSSGFTRVVPSSAALLATNTRAVPASVALLASGLTRVVPASTALLQTNSRAVPASAALLLTLSRAIVVAAALAATDTRVVAATAALLGTNTRAVPASVQLSGANVPVVPGSCAVSDSAVGVVTLSDSAVGVVVVSDSPAEVN